MTSEPTRRSSLLFALALGLAVAAFAFVTMPGEEYPGDAQAPRMQALNFLRTGQWTAPPEIASISGERGHFFFQNARGDWYPKYGVLNTGLYLLPLALEKAATGHLEFQTPDHILYLNLLNVLFSGATAFYLVLLARRYVASHAIIALFVMAALFATFWWNYLRGQTFEVFHACFLLALFYHFVRGLDDESPHLFLSALYLGALVLSKSVYLALLLPLAFLLVRQNPRRLFLSFALPIAVALVLFALFNWLRFDSPFANGYTQSELERQLFSLRNLGPALIGFLFDPHYSIFFHFPLVIPALFSWPRFYRAHRRDALVVLAISATLFFINSLYNNWRGEASYGPRYLLPILPLLSLPFLEFCRWIGEQQKAPVKFAAIGATTLLLGYATLLQACVTTLPFFFCYDLKGVLDDPRHSDAAHYLRAHSFADIDRDFLLRRDAFDKSFTDRLHPAEAVRLRELLTKTRTNFYWFPRAVKTDT